MYISIRRYQVDIHSVDEIVQRVEAEFVPIIRQAPGFIAYYAIDAGGGVVASISIFRDQAGAEESNRRAAGWVKMVGPLFPGAPQTTAGVVRVQSGG
jgi:hypothetical protein